MGAGAIPDKWPYAGFVLAGGRSSRMGRDKAMLPIGGTFLLKETYRKVQNAAGSAVVVGAPQRYQGLGMALAADLVEGCGPLGGLYTALKLSSKPWNLVVACDMPGLTQEFLGDLLRAARERNAVCLVPVTGSCLHPLCAVYRRDAIFEVEVAILNKSLKMHDLLTKLDAARWPLKDANLVGNVNTPADWLAP
jgi:molybdopterin-guanine dinucleotide biosynthesis protein A